MTEIKKVSKSDVPNELRRTLLKTSWVVPVITVVGLPAHAQTSPPPTTTNEPSCTMTDLAGDWTAELSHDPDALMNNFTLNADGTGSNRDGDPFNWTLSGSTFGINNQWEEDGKPATSILTATVQSNCSSMSGQGTDGFLDGSDSVTYTFNATKN